MSINFHTFHASDDDEHDEDQPTQPIPVQAPPQSSAPDLAYVDQFIRDAQVSYRRRNCLICQMVYEIESGESGPGIAEEDLCDEHWARFTQLAAKHRPDHFENIDTIRRICQYARNRNIWPPDHHEGGLGHGGR